ncbi:Mini-ribonuclease 3 [Thermosediminibacter oceani]|uniref:Mini-ribonuclease 3 n=1 Tax=Thermosediminibacter oceani (strain ATCC BAA-1034 / DSM 16646 / JW/IW-1228P) TaxID=555079 RepID=D9S0G9_THEOJ|nr:ribonuclease III domain-containing protein [Thermosediminibacter oceani]ADL08827.1 ribonuclease III [Thermosediminibacter oceani DSM 16646]
MEGKKLDVSALSSLALAFVGDAVFNLFIRTMLVGNGKKVRDLHHEAVKYVRASAQAEALKKLEEYLTPEEKDVVRKARNAKVNTVPKNADIMDYHYSTGFEALLGYLYLTGQNDRLNRILMASFELVNSGRDTGRS